MMMRSSSLLLLAVIIVTTCAYFHPVLVHSFRMLLRVVKTLGSMGVELLYKVVLHLVHRWNIKAGIKNCGEPDLGHASFSRLRELLRMAEKLGIQGSIPDFKLAPADYNPPELFGAMWKPE